MTTESVQSSVTTESNTSSAATRSTTSRATSLPGTSVVTGESHNVKYVPNSICTSSGDNIVLYPDIITFFKIQKSHYLLGTFRVHLGPTVFRIQARALLEEMSRFHYLLPTPAY